MGVGAKGVPLFGEQHSQATFVNRAFTESAPLAPPSPNIGARVQRISQDGEDPRMRQLDEASLGRSISLRMSRRKQESIFGKVVDHSVRTPFEWESRKEKLHCTADLCR